MDNFTGLIPDPRTPEQKSTDYQHSEVAGAVAINWQVKDPSQWKKYSIRNQNGAWDCVGNGCAKAIETNTGEVESAHPIYARRANFPDHGMYLQNGGSISVKSGTASEQSDPSNNTTEAQMDMPVTVPTPIKPFAYIFINPTDIDAIAEGIESGKGVAITFNGFLSEWNNCPVSNGQTVGMDLQHCVCAVDYFIYNGEKAILIDDSWGLVTSIGNGGQRIITESYLKARCNGAMYFVMQAPAPVKPKHTFSKLLAYGMMADADVKALQQILAYEGLFPATLETGNYLNITASAVYKWQVAHNVAPVEELNALKGKNVGPKTIAMLNQLYS